MITLQRTSGFIVYLGSNPISWKSSKKRIVARSSTEAKYRVLANSSTKTSWITSLLKELQAPLQKPPNLLCDKIGATYLSANLVFHSRMKHLDIDYHFVRQNVQAGNFTISYINSKEQLADGFKKPHYLRCIFLHLRAKTGVVNGFSVP